MKRWVLFASIFQTMFVPYLDRDLHVSAGLIGLLFTVGSAGGLVGAAAAPYVARAWGDGPAAVAGVTFMVIGGQDFVAVIVWSLPPVPALTVLALTQCFVAAGNALSNVAYAAIHQRLLPIRLLGRTGAALRVLGLGVPGLAGAVLGGLLGTWIGPGATMASSAMAMLSAVAWIWHSPLRTTRDLPESADARY